MSLKRGKQKEAVEEDFEAFVRHRLSSISDDQKEMRGTQVKIQRDIEFLQVKSRKWKLDFKTEGIFGYKAGGINRTTAWS